LRANYKDEELISYEEAKARGIIEVEKFDPKLNLFLQMERYVQVISRLQSKMHIVYQIEILTMERME
jgi:hypothetical protein